MNPRSETDARHSKRTLFYVLGGTLAFLGVALIVASLLHAVLTRASLHRLEAQIAALAPSSDEQLASRVAFTSSVQTVLAAPLASRDPAALNMTETEATTARADRPTTSGAEDTTAQPQRVSSSSVQSSASASDGGAPSSTSEAEKGAGASQAAVAEASVGVEGQTGANALTPRTALPAAQRSEGVSDREAKHSQPSLRTPDFTVRSGDETYSFAQVDLEARPQLGTLPEARIIHIPAIGLKRSVVPLTLETRRGYQPSYSNPESQVGIVPNAGNPGEAARGWYFGHLRAPLFTDGGAFHDLPKVVDLLAQGKAVDVILETAEAAYLYRVSGKPKVLKAVEFHSEYFHKNLYSPEPEIVLVSCVPAWEWGSRLLVTARLVGIGPLPGREDTIPKP